jgi:hypothetical protein
MIQTLSNNGITGAVQSPSDAMSFLMPGKAVHPSQATKLSKTERAARYNRILVALTEKSDRLYLPFSRILAAASFVQRERDKKTEPLLSDSI